MKKRCVFSVLIVLAAAACSATARADTIDTLSGWNGSDGIGSFGRNDTSDYGQTITVGSANVLQSFEFVMQLYYGTPASSNFQGYVMAWNNSTDEATGPVLYQSPVMSFSNTGDWEDFTFNTGGLVLTAGNQYVLFVNTADNPGPDYAAYMASRENGDIYPGGLFVFQNNDEDFSQLTQAPWSLNWQGPGYDTAFRATFSTSVAGTFDPRPVGRWCSGAAEPRMAQATAEADRVASERINTRIRGAVNIRLDGRFCAPILRKAAPPRKIDQQSRLFPLVQPPDELETNLVSVVLDAREQRSILLPCKHYRREKNLSHFPH